MSCFSTDPKESEAPRWVAGADGYRDGWVVVLRRFVPDTVRCRVLDSVDAVLNLPEEPVVIGLDMVIGCPDQAKRGGRACDQAARSLLGHPRGASVFSPPAYAALGAETYEEAQRRNRKTGPDAPGLSKQTYHLFPKMRAVARRMTPARQERVREVHPELSFYAMNGDAPVDAGKRTDEGRKARIDLLNANGFPNIESTVSAHAGGALGPDDMIDAHAACWTARRIHDGTAERCPPCDDPAPRNARGLRMEIWR